MTLLAKVCCPCFFPEEPRVQPQDYRPQSGYQGPPPGYQGAPPGYQGATPGYQGEPPGYQGPPPGYYQPSPGYGPSADADQYYQQVQYLIKADIRMFSGCADKQTSADVGNARRAFGIMGTTGPNSAGGACTSAMLIHLERSGGQTSWIGLLQAMQHELRQKGYSQVPQLSGSRPIELDGPFTLTNPRPNGRTKALLIGINYRGQGNELRGCHNDVQRMRDYLVHRAGYDADMCVVLMDDGQHKYPSKEEIRRAIGWFVGGAAAGDSLFFQYSGHGGQVRDTSGDERDGYDECIFPVDHRQAGPILDDELYRTLVAPLPEGVHVTCVFDSCHSGTVLDLPYNFMATSQAMDDYERTGRIPSMMQNMDFDIGTVAGVMAAAGGLALAAGLLDGGLGGDWLSGGLSGGLGDMVGDALGIDTDFF